ncbi:MAG: DUF2156 domain-containing protein [Deltaproteobacteria bacterium]|nr:MAG: DUF2156 domain-containing protein [Deltaproteobacteria bacterium]
MNLEFEPIDLKKQKDYLKRLSECSQLASDYSFANLWGWEEEYGLQWAWHDNLVWLKQTKPSNVYWAPVGQWTQVDWNKIFENIDQHTVFTRIPEELINIWRPSLGDRIRIEEERRNWDYIYSLEELIELKGNRFHKKRNLLNQFIKKYDYKFVNFGPELVEPAMAMQEDWCNWRNCESSEILAAENRAVLKIFMNWDKLVDLTGGAILVDNMIVAYTVAEKYSPDTVLIHYEKGCPDYKGVYQAINQMFLAHLTEAFKWVNREQDLGEEGLRKAKLSYNPVEFLRKYRVISK